MAPLTIRQMTMLAYMRWFQARNDNMPTAALLAARFRITKSGADQTVQAIAKKGHLLRIDGMRGHRFADRRAGVPEHDPSLPSTEDDDITVDLLRRELRIQTDDPWIVWGGVGPCPVPPGRSIEVRFRDSALQHVDALAAQRLRWHHQWAGGDVIAYRLR